MYTKIVLVRSIMSNAVEEIVTKEEVIWSTWEELLLAFAVKRYGLKDWDTVAMELQNRRRHHHHHHHHHHHRGSSLPQGSYTAQICKDKYRNLKRRFTNHHHDGGGEGGGGGSENNNESKFQSDDDDDENDEVIGGGGGDDAFPWLEELRKLRVAELKQEVHRYDVSIRSLQIKVKTMEEERENSLKEDRNDDVKQQQPDLDDEEVQRERSENDNKSNNGDKDMPPEQVGGKSVSASAGNDENMSFNESNSAGKRKTFLKIEPENEPPEVKPDPHVKPPGVGGEDSCNDSSDRHEIKKKKMNQEREKDDGRGDSDEFRDSVVESKEGTKESSDVQSSVSLLTSKRKRRRGEGEDGGGGGGKGSTGPIKRESEGGAVKSEPNVFLLLDKIRARAHKHGSVFERRLQSQKTEKYKNTIRRHVDLETVQARIDDGSYSSCPTKFYVDLLLLFNNAIVFFPKASTESLAAQELREIVMKELKNNSSGPQPTVKLEPPKPELERSDSLLARHKSTNPSVVCRKRSSISAKASSSSANKVEKQKDNDKPVSNSKPLIKSPLSATSNEEEDSVKLQIKEKPVTGARSMRRSSKARTKTESTPNNSNSKSLSSQQHGVKDKVEAGKGDKKSVTAAAAATVKKSSAADFLKRMKKNSPAKGTLVEALKSSKDNTKGGGKKDQQKKKLDKRKDGPVRRSAAGGGGNRKQTKEESSPSKRNIGRSSRKGKKEVVVSGRKRGRDGGEGEGSSKRAKKRSR